MFSEPTPHTRPRGHPLGSPHHRAYTTASERLLVAVDRSLRAVFVEMTTHAPEYMANDFLFELLEIEQRIHRGVAVERMSGRSDIAFRVLFAAREQTFCLGGDLRLFRETIRTGNRDVLSGYARAACDLIWSSVTGGDGLGLTTIALVRGEAFGGGFEAALAAHLLVAERGATFAFPESLFGLFPGMGANALLRCRAGSEVEQRVTGSSRIWQAQELHDLGVIDVLADAGTGPEVVRQWMRSVDTETQARLRARFEPLTLRELYDTVDGWVEQAMALDRKHLRAMDYIINAQTRRSSAPMPAGVVPAGSRAAARVHD